MAHLGKKQIVLSSLLDRLIDQDPDNQQELSKSQRQQLAELYQSIRRDLENLLNSRSSGIQWPNAWNELNTSLFSYGLEDFMGNVRSQFCENLSVAIQRFEPRFKAIEVKLLASTDDQDRTLRIRIEGLLYVGAAPEPIIFDSVLEPETHHFLIKEASFN